MTKLSLNKAAAHAGKAKADILKALKSNDPMKKLSGEKNAKGHWEIDPAELDRFFGTSKATLDQTGSKNGLATPSNSSENSALAREVELLREQISRIDQMHERERDQLAETIRQMREDHRQALAVISDQREPKIYRKKFLGFIPYGEPIKVAG